MGHSLKIYSHKLTSKRVGKEGDRRLIFTSLTGGLRGKNTELARKMLCLA